MGVLLMSHFPPRGSELVEEDDATNTTNTREGDVRGLGRG